ncbi:thioredoxin-disulfide reductase [Lysinibacillus fusiformis]|uniref:thioredoxin-disulfide reductase n=1 Tax=Lysinibacillus fusiformis TaxID=28031 RepID=UPI001967C340|nr:thioredoxin-disulfide reductase [Lysinibacillus fusiformis]QSB08734.1 thioredoxin-disulfide reductase [Lysinibacillus fusiformis]
MYKVIILGSGPAGLTAAIYLARANLNPIIFEGKQSGGQLTMTTDVENFPGFVNGISGPVLIENMRKQAERFGAKFKRGWVSSVDLSERPFKLVINEKETIETESLIISTGASAKLLNIPGEFENIGRGISTCATCDGSFYTNKKVIVVGGGDSAMEEALFLTKYASEVIIVHRRNELRASKIMQQRAKENNKIKWSLNKKPIEMVIDNGNVIGLKVMDLETKKESIIESDGIFISIGHTPNTTFLNNQLTTDGNGYILVKPGSSKTNVDGVFACGDVQDSKYRQAITAAGTGCMAALDVEQFIDDINYKKVTLSINNNIL